MSLWIRWRAKATFWPLLIFEKSGDPSAFFGNPPLVATGAAVGAAIAVDGPLRENEGAAADIVTFGLGFTVVAGAVALGTEDDGFTAPPVPE